MQPEIILIGKNSSIGTRLVPFLNTYYSFYTLSAASLLTTIHEGKSLVPLFQQYFQERDRNSDIERLFLLCYRVRAGGSVAQLVSDELVLLRGILQGICKSSHKCRIVIIGSPTGGLVHKRSDEAYHYQKDLQKSIFRYFSGQMGESQYLNMIEVWSSFIKYEAVESTPDYLSFLSEVRNAGYRKRLIDYSCLASAVRFLFDSGNQVNGSIVKLDNGLSNVQHF